MLGCLSRAPATPIASTNDRGITLTKHPAPNALYGERERKREKKKRERKRERERERVKEVQPPSERGCYSRDVTSGSSGFVRDRKEKHKRDACTILEGISGV